MIADYEGDISTLFDTPTPDVVPVLATRNLVLFPGVVTPILVGRAASVSLVNKLKKDPEQVFAVFCQKNADIEEPGKKDLFPIGVYAKLVRVLEMSGPGNNITAIVQGLGRCQLEDVVKRKPYLVAQTTKKPEIFIGEDTSEYHTAMEDLRSQTVEFIKMNEEMPDEAQFAIANIHHDVIATNFICSNMPFDLNDKMHMLEADNSLERVYIALKTLNKEMQLLQIKQTIRSKTREDIDEQQREYFLQQQIKNIKEELGNGEGSPEHRELEEKAKGKKWSEEVSKIFYKELDKLDTLNQQSPDYSIQLTYLQTMVGLPWNEYTKDDLSIKRAQKVLDHDHYGMEKVKDRILEHLAVLQLSGDLKSPIICLYGPPGVGKTSLGKSIATAMNRKYVRMSLGGLHDESEIRGHRRTYVGAMPGRIIKSIQKAGSSNPVFILDEIDKVTQNTLHGDPSSALLEVLDPEQNNAFHDNYLDVDFDLSRVLFIATANDLNTIPRPLLDRMELIEVSGYITEEKIEIAKRHLIPKELKNTGLDTFVPRIKFNKAALEFMIERYTRESGVRSLTKQIAAVMRKLAWATAAEEQLPEAITPELVREYLGKTVYSRDKYQGNEHAGVVVGLAWTSVGGEILFVESSLQPGQSGKLILTGSLGDVMKESATLALSYIRAHATQLGIDLETLKDQEIHIHVPEGAIPKDGPSAGITMVTSLVSAMTRRRVRAHMAMTGEITLRGKVLPVGGIKEKILAAKRSGITDIILCRENEKDILEINEHYLEGLNFHYVDEITEVLDFALLDEIVDKAK